MKEYKLTKIHCWSFADSKDGYKANQKVLLYQGKDFIKVMSKQNSSTPGIRNCIDVRPNTNYILSVKGYSEKRNAFLWVQDAHTKKRLNCEYVYLPCKPCEPCWVCLNFNTEEATKIDFGVLFTNPKCYDCMLIYEVELCRYDEIESYECVDYCCLCDCHESEPEECPEPEPETEK